MLIAASYAARLCNDSVYFMLSLFSPADSAVLDDLCCVLCADSAVLLCGFARAPRCTCTNYSMKTLFRTGDPPRLSALVAGQSTFEHSSDRVETYYS